MFLEKTPLRRGFFLAALLSATLCGGLAACSPAHDKAAAYVKSAQALYDANDTHRAKLEVQNALQVEPRNARALYLLALVSEREEDYRAVLGSLQMAVQSEPDFVDARVKLGNYYAVGLKVQETREQADAAMKLAPQNPAVRVLNARAYYIAGEKSRALDEARAALALDARRRDAITLIASIHAEAGEMDEALAVVDGALQGADAGDAERLRRVKVALLLQAGRAGPAEQELLKMAAEYPQVTLYDDELARLYVSQGRWSDAEVRLRALVAKDPGNVQWVVPLAKLLARQGRPDDAVATLQQGIAATPAAPAPKFALATLYESLQRPAEARALYEAIAQAQPRTDEGLAARNRLVALAALQDRGRARTLVEQVLADAPGNADALLYRAAFDFQDGKLNEAIADLRAVLAKAPGAQRALLLLGRTYVRNGDHALAEDTYRKLLDANPASVEGKRELALLLGGRGEVKEAEQVLREALEASPADAESSQALASTLLKQGDFKGAEAEARRMQAAGSPSGLADYELGLALQSQNQDDRAIAAYRQALDKTPVADEPLTALTRLLLKTHRVSEAEEYLQRHIKAHPEHVTARVLLGTVYRETDRIDLARNTLRQVVADHPDAAGAYLALASTLEPASAEYRSTLVDGHRRIPGDPGIGLALGAALQRAGGVEDAIKVYDEVLAAGGRSDFVVSNLAQLLLDHRTDKGSHARALQLTMGFEKSASHPFQLGVLGWAYYRSGQYANAVRLLERAVGTGANGNPQLLYYAGMAHLKNGDRDVAGRLLKQAVETAGATHTSFAGLDEARAALKTLQVAAG